MEGESEPEITESQREGRPAAFASLAHQIVVFVFTATFVTAMLASWVAIQSSRSSLRETADRLYGVSLRQASERVEPWLVAMRADLRCPPAGQSATPQAPWVGQASFYTEPTPTDAWGEVPQGAQAALRADTGIALVTLADGRLGVALATLPASREPGCVGIARFDALAPVLALALPSDDAAFVLTDASGRALLQTGDTSFLGNAERLPIENWGQERLRETRFGSEEILAATRSLAPWGWRIAIVASTRSLYAPLVASIQRVLLIDAVVIALFCVFAYRVTSRVTGPIGQLSAVARRVADGETALEIPEPPQRDEIGILTRAFNAMLRRQREYQTEIESTNRRLQDRYAALQQATEVLNQLSITDGLTKLHNHRFFQDHLTREIRRVERAREDLAMLIIDIDDFKKLNDQYGHAGGDEVLARIAGILNAAVRGGDLCARYGGEEFVILAPNTDIEGGYALAEKTRMAIEETDFLIDEAFEALKVTVSIGVAAYRGDRKAFFGKADQALYQAKANGKNCVVVHPDDLA
ncbi:MAG: diguanylate cyclase [Myxococcota bacterium]